MASWDEERARRVARIVQIYVPLISWIIGIVVFLVITFTGAAHRDPEWWVVLGALMSLPVATIGGSRAGRNGSERKDAPNDGDK